METNHAQESSHDRQLQAENARLKFENERLKRDNKHLKRSLLTFQNIAKNYESKKQEVLALKAVNKLLTEQIKELKRKTIDLERLVENQDCEDRLDRLLLELQQDGQVCNKNCALCAVLKICKIKLGYSLCGTQLALILLSKLPSDEITREDLKCEKVLDLLEKAKIVHVKSENLYPDTRVRKLEMVNRVWIELMTMSGNSCILGLKCAKARGGGHCVVFDLDSRKNGTVMVYDPQAASLKEASMDRVAFRKYVEDGEGIRLYILDFKQLEDTIYDFRDVMHVTEGERFFYLSMAV